MVAANETKPLWEDRVSERLFYTAFLLLPFIAIFADNLAWFLTKWDPVYAYTVLVAGVSLGLAWAAQILISLYQIWFSKPAELDSSMTPGAEA